MFNIFSTYIKKHRFIIGKGLVLCYLRNIFTLEAIVLFLSLCLSEKYITSLIPLWIISWIKKINQTFHPWILKDKTMHFWHLFKVLGQMEDWTNIGVDTQPYLTYFKPSYRFFKCLPNLCDKLIYTFIS